MRVAAVQFCPKFGDRNTNIQTLIRMGTKAAASGAKLVVFPELATTGYSLMSTAEARAQAEVIREKQASVGAMLKLAQRLNVGFAWGLVELAPSGELHNSQVLALPDGSVTSYAKVNRWANDFLWAKPGPASPPIIDYLGKKVGLLICRDVRDKAPEWEDFYEPGDADIVVFSTNWGDGGFPSVNWHKFATNNEVWLVVSNRFGRERNNNFGEGGPCVISPKGDVHCEGLVWSQPCIVYAETSG